MLNLSLSVQAQFAELSVVPAFLRDDHCGWVLSSFLALPCPGLHPSGTVFLPCPALPWPSSLRYCSRSCQAANWDVHRSVCQQFQ